MYLMQQRCAEHSLSAVLMTIKVQKHFNLIIYTLNASSPVLKAANELQQS